MARRMMSRFGQWSSYVYAVDFDANSDPIYFALASKHSEQPQVFRNVLADETCYSLHVQSDDQIERAKFYGGLKNKLSKELPPECTILEMFTFQPNVKDSVIKGYFIKDASKSSATERVLGELLRNDPVYVCSYLCGGEDRQWSQHLWSNTEDGWVEVLEKYCVVPAEKPEHHPSTLNIINYDVFYSFEDAYKVLQQCVDIIPESKAVLELVDQRPESKEKTAFPVIVIEGLDATGKSTLTESLTEALGATLLKSPPQCLSPWRARFDTEPPLIRRAFYALGNYLTAGQIGQEARQAPVIVDRYWHSTAAYAIATAVGGKLGNLPQAGSEVYGWPGDLLRPSLVLMLSLSSQERMRRLQVRGQDKTMEEEELEANHLFRQKVEEAYQRVGGPACITVDASPSPDQVLQQVLLLIREKCHL
ncbi:UMP-CMP kinase 2, mitochondrial [Salmo salar]|uniref:UMP-CMP kinase 2, mitochondrial n=2 Tax=Salmo salar TaxID=8030 RepID=A0A1S2WYT7_SALSA|nr:UMP-CMP kinase 2, mitochondrial [Salmo salar]|eukprot:NP_001117091.2 UMP-CMP kinase 2, mitochondrial [Salmo salar]